MVSESSDTTGLPIEIVKHCCPCYCGLDLTRLLLTGVFTAPDMWRLQGEKFTDQTSNESVGAAAQPSNHEPMVTMRPTLRTRDAVQPGTHDSGSRLVLVYHVT